MAKDTATPAYQSIKLDTLPRRNAGPRIDMDAAKALVAMLTNDPDEGVTDGIEYETAEKARTAGLRAARLAAHAAPAGKVPSVRTGQVGDGWAFAVTLKNAKSANGGK